MIIERVNENHLEDALILALSEYESECSITKSLPKIDFREQVSDLLLNLFKQGYGFVAKEDGKIAGYLAFYGPLDGFFGNCIGAFSPLGGSAFSGKNREKLSSQLLSATTEMLLQEEGVTSFALSRYANDTKVGKSLALNGFGIRCSDAIMKLDKYKPKKLYNPNMTIIELSNEKKGLILDLRLELVKHLLQSPVYYPTHIGNYMDWFAKEEVRVFAAYENGEILGFISIQDGAETFVSEAAFIKNICGAFVRKEYRGKNLATDLLHYVCNLCKQEGAEYLGVDCETLNPTALRFWAKHFENYTYSYHRRIDERVIGYDSYLACEWDKIKI